MILESLGILFIFVIVLIVLFYFVDQYYRVINLESRLDKIEQRRRKE